MASSAPAHFRFFDNREKYLQFVTTCGEKRAVAERVGRELAHLRPAPPRLALFDAGTGDGTVLMRVLRHLHERFPTIPLLVVGKEISLEDVRLALEKLPDRFHEHPQMVLVLTNLYYSEAPWLRPNARPLTDLNWHEVALEGSSAHAFDTQIAALHPLLRDGWQTVLSARTGNPLYAAPSVLVLYRADQRFALDRVIPRKGEPIGGFDLVVASQPYRARVGAEFKVWKVLAPLARSLAPGGRMVVVQSTGKDPGMEVIRKIWPDEDPFRSPRRALISAMRRQLAASDPGLRYLAYADRDSHVRYDLHALPSEVGGSIGTSTLLAAWNAAVYVAQIEDHRLAEAMQRGGYMAATREVLRRHGGLWFLDESFIVARRRPGRTP